MAQIELGRCVLGAIDRSSSKGTEGQADIAWRHDQLRKIGYKRERDKIRF